MIKAVVFDMFETLVTLFEGRTYFSEDIASDTGVPLNDFRREWHRTEYDRSIGRCTVEEGLRTALAAFGEYPEDKIQLVLRKRQEALNDSFSAVPDDSVDLLEKLRERGFLTGLITNAFSDERDMIRACPLFPLIDAAAISYEHGICKPDAAIYRAVLDKLGVKAEECLYVGDGGSRELYAARDIGMHPVQAAWFRERAFEPHIPCPELEEFVQAAHQSDVLTIAENMNRS